MKQIKIASASILVAILVGGGIAVADQSGEAPTPTTSTPVTTQAVAEQSIPSVSRPTVSLSPRPTDAQTAQAASLPNDPSSKTTASPTAGDDTTVLAQTSTPTLVSSNLECGWQDTSGDFGLLTTVDKPLPSGEVQAQLRLDTYSDGTSDLVDLGAAASMCASTSN